MPHSTSRLIIAGWSTRAAAQSAQRAGYDVVACDVFLDADTATAAGECRRIADLREVVAATTDLPPTDWLYTGGMENHPPIVAAMNRRHRLLGCDETVLRRVRDPRILQRVLADCLAPLPEMRSSVIGLPSDRAWLIKRRSSGGGLGVMPYLPGTSLPRGGYLQEFVAGVSCGATYLAADGDCRFMGLCRQLTVLHDHDRPYLYGGSIGPLSINPQAKAILTQLGNRLASEFALRGLFGVDVILTPDGSIRTLEVNPRYTASMELLERNSGRSLLRLHVQACRDGLLPESIPNSPTIHGKRIIYADDQAAGEISADLAAVLVTESQRDLLPQLADLPTAGTRPQPGEPLLTILADGATPDEVVERLNQQESRVRRLFAAPRQTVGDSASSRTGSRRRRPSGSGS